MFRRSPFFVLACSIALSLIFGCGGGGNPTPTAVSTPTTPSPTGANPAPSPSPTPTPTPTPAPGGQGANPGMYQVNVVLTAHPFQIVGQVTVDPVSNNGDMEVKINQVERNEDLTVNFCPFGQANVNCFAVGKLSTDANGNADATMKFPRAGTWAGIFKVSGSNSDFTTEPAAFGGNFATATGQSYRASLQPESNVTGGIGRATTPGTISSGFVSEVLDTLHAEVHGVTPNATYELIFCPNAGSNFGCNQYANSSFGTDASGNGSLDTKVTFTSNAEVFFVRPQNGSGAGYITAFVVQ